MPVAGQYFSFPAINAPASGVFSFKSGTPTVIFSIPAQDRLLDVGELKLVGNLKIKDSGGTLITDKANISDSQGAAISKATSTNISPLTGVQGSISKVVLQSKKTRQEIAQIVNYPDYLAVRQAYLHNKVDFRTMPNNKTLASGADALYMSRRMTLSSDGGKPFSTALQAVPLLTGQNLHLGEDRMGGLIITLHLAPDDQFLCSYFRSVGAGQGNGNPTGASYELADLQLEGRYLVPSPQDISSYPGTLGMASRLSLLGDLVSSVDSQVYTPQVGAVQAFVGMYQTQTQENNILRCSEDFKLPVGVENYRQYKDGILHPFKYPIESKPSFRSSVENGTGALDSSSLVSKCHGFGSAEIQKVFERSLFSGREMAHVLVGLPELSESIDAEYDTRTGGTPGTDGVGLNLAVAPLGLSADQTFNIEGQSQSYMNRDYQIKLVSGVGTGNALLPPDFSSVSYLQREFVPHTELLDTKT
ncbi:MAG: hypothetical protein ACR2M9_03355, partial [Cyanophyceae cyanobacterium]